MKKSKIHEITKKGIKKIGTRPCAVCSDKAFAVISFQPDNPAAFGMTEDQALYVPMCAQCLNEGPDLEFLESTLLNCGVEIKAD